MDRINFIELDLHYSLTNFFHFKPFQDNNQTREAKFMFQFVAEAYEVLTDDEKRKNYDIYGTPTSTMGGQSKGPQRPYYHQNYNAEELYSKIFGEAGLEI